ncbi:hypothetical protein HMPREF1600_02611 [Escherichia coli 907715]|nr:hypothetical protein HMPREF1600_02611 [Escherichia coli 907715]
MFSEFPAPAGINRLGRIRSRAYRRVPRASGDKPYNPASKLNTPMSSPRQRG